MSKLLDHYTIDTGHLYRSPRSEVTIDTALLAPLLSSGEHEMPGFPGYRVRVTNDNGVLAASVFSGPAPLVTLFVCPTDAAIATVRKVTGAIPAQPLTAPALLVQTHPTLKLDTSAVSWLADFERCLAWAFLEQTE